MTLRDSLRRAAMAAGCLGLAAFVSACQTTKTSNVVTPLKTDAQFDAKASEYAIAVIGESHDSVSHNCPSLHSFWVASVTPENQGKGKPFQLASVACSFQPTPVRYNVIQLEPGFYALNSITHRHARNVETTTFLPAKVSFGAARTLKFRVGKGDVVYFGDILWGTPYPAKIQSLKYNLPAAREALQKYPGITGELRPARFQPLPPAGSTPPTTPVPPPEDGPLEIEGVPDAPETSS